MSAYLYSGQVINQGHIVLEEEGNDSKRLFIRLLAKMEPMNAYVQGAVVNKRTGKVMHHCVKQAI